MASEHGDHAGHLTARPFTSVFVVWHPLFAEGKTIADAIYDHYRRDSVSNVAGATGLEVGLRSQPPANEEVPIGIPHDSAETTAVVVLVTRAMVDSPAWMQYVRAIAERADLVGLRMRVFPVAVDDGVIEASNDLGNIQFVRWDEWTNTTLNVRIVFLLQKLSYGLCRMLRLHLQHLQRPLERPEELEQYLTKVKVFLSHSKHDSHGKQVAENLRLFINGSTELDSFFDVLDIPAGLPFADVLMHYVRVSAVIALHSDSFSSREWCRREILEAKLARVPLLVVNCMMDADGRGFPYMGNVPIMRLEPERLERIPFVIGLLLDEVLKDFLWQCRVTLLGTRATTETVFVPRQPEILLLAHLRMSQPTGEIRLLVYPDPPLGVEEVDLFNSLAPTVILRSFTEWVAESYI